ncbi:MAG: NAD(+) synthase [Planctomycetota bacterium]
MKLINVGAAVLNQTPLDWTGNKANILTAIESARRQGVTVLCLPELCLCGYGCEDAFFSAALRRTAREVLSELLPATVGMVVTLGLPVLHRNSLYDAVCVVADGRVAGYVPKSTLAGSGLHYEPRWFKRWPPDVRDVLTYDGVTYPVGDLHFELGGIKIGLEICEEAWGAARRGAALARRGVDILLNPSASHFAFGKQAIRERFVLEGSRAFGAAYVYANLLGNEAGRVIYDGGALIATAGRLVAVGPRFSYGPAHVISAVVDIDEVRTARAELAEAITPPGPSADVGCVHVDLPLPALRPQAPVVRRPPWEHAEHHKEEEFTRAVGLALCDYLRKARSRGFVVSLSGGADSSAVASLAALGVHLGCAGLGVEAFKERFGLADLADAETPEAIVGEILTCVYQATANSTDATRDAARGLAAALGARYHELDLEPIVYNYVDLMTRTMGRPLTWETDDIVLQNIQARVRAPAAWMLANLTDALLLATSNRSEAAVGYTTMDGDTAGGLSPIAGIDKAFLGQWLTWLETHGPTDLGPIGALAAVNALTPTAELRPPAMGQTDERDLMPYPLLDAIEAAAIRDKNAPAEVYALMAARFPQYAPEQLAAWVDRFFDLWCRNQWKRERYAPSFHVDDKNLDPKTWCRFPILSGHYRRERDRLRREVEQGG